MKKFLLLTLVGILSLPLLAQTTDTVYLKNGSVIRGSVIESIPNETIKIKTKDGSVFVYNQSEVEKITKEEGSKLNMPDLSSLNITPAYADKTIRYGVRAGFNASKLGSDILAYKYKVGANAGLVAEIPLTSNIYFEPSLLYSLKGAKIKEADEGDDDNYYKQIATTHLHYLEVPLHIGIKYPINEKLSALFDAGPYFAFGLAGSTKVKTSWHYYDDSGSETETTKLTNKDWNKFDWGLGVKLGAELYNKYRLSLGYDWGQQNVNKGDSDDIISAKVKNRCFHIDLTYMF